MAAALVGDRTVNRDQTPSIPDNEERPRWTRHLHASGGALSLKSGGAKSQREWWRSDNAEEAEITGFGKEWPVPRPSSLFYVVHPA